MTTQQKDEMKYGTPTIKTPMLDLAAANETKWHDWLISYGIRRDRILKALGIGLKRLA